MADMSSEKPVVELNTLADRLKWARERKNWSQPHLALVAGVSTSTVGMIESGARVNKGSLPALADALGVRYKWLLHGEAPISEPVFQSHDEFLIEEANRKAPVGVTTTPIGTAKIQRPEPLSPEVEQKMTRMLLTLYQIPQEKRAAALSAAIEVLIDHLPPIPSA